MNHITETMTSRERVCCTLFRRPVDRYPIDLGAHPSTGISAFAYHHLREHLGLDVGPVDVYDVVQFLARVDEDVLERFHGDFILVEPRPASSHIWNPRGAYQFEVPEKYSPTRDEELDRWIVRQGEHKMSMPQGGYFFDGDWLSMWREEPYEEQIAIRERAIERAYKESDYAFIDNAYSCPKGFGGFFWGIEQACQLLTDPDTVKRQLGEWADWAIALFDRTNDTIGQYLSMITLTGDLGSQTQAFIRPEWFEEFYLPHVKRFTSHVHAHSDIKVLLHSCGAQRELMPGLIEAGIDVLNPVQISAVGMDAAELKAEYGDDIIFFGGGCDTQNVLGSKTPDEVRQHVTELTNIFKPGGGFIFNQVHNIMGNVPPENIVALFDAAYENSAQE